MILYIENPKKCTKKLLELTNKLIRVSGSKIHIPKSVVSPYICNEQSENKLEKMVQFIMASKIKYVGINSTKV